MSGTAAEPLWSDLQLSWLQAMGHTVYLDRATAATAPGPATEVAPVLEAGPTRAQRPEARVPPQAPVRRSAPAAPPEAMPASRAAAPAVRRARVGLPDRLQIALLRASGCNPNDPETQRLMATWPLDALRADPAAKRALWPQLRALRRRSSP
ncbi:alanine acetyltransferase [[Pseudomonas] boreopolis]|uniref:Alanine acetyltransferase n=1 Tax=Xanthomonas boreopolis TaxID=86183 RepID=A0A919KJ94_9XANT|nr:alanine acetyltransferase [[Pseudomonas] boreopolis]